MRLPAFSRTPTVRNQLMLLVAALLVPLLAVVVVLIARINATERTDAQESVRQVARALSLAVDTEYTRSVTALQILSQSAAFARGDLETIRRRMGAARDQHGGWATVILIDTDGRRLINLRVPQGQPVTSADDVAWRKALADRRPQPMDVVRSPTSGLPAAGVVVPVIVNGEARYALMATLEAPNWSALLARDLPPGWIAAVDDRNGITMARSERADQQAGQPAPKTLLDLYASRASGMARIQTREGHDAYAGFQTSSLTGWRTSVIVPAETVDEPLQRRLATIVLGALAVLAAAMLVAFRASRRLSRGIRSLATAVRALREDAPVEYRLGNVREVDEVGQAIAVASADLRQLRADLAERATLAEEANHLKDRFLGLLGHELRNPLAAISGANDVIARHTSRDDVKRMSAVIDRQTRHLAHLVDDLLDASPVASAGAPVNAELFDLADVLREVHASREAAGTLRDLEVHVAAGPAPVVGDREGLLDVIDRLFDNALRYTPPGGRITASTRTEVEWAVFEIRDSGQGMDAALLRHAFEPFTQGPQPAHMPRGGVGLGLATVRHVVERHAGSVKAASSGAGLGATFVVRMPLAQGAAAPIAPPLALEALTPMRVAVVEDNGDVRESLVERLRQYGHTVRAAADGVAGVKMLSIEPFDVALIDISLPGLDGLEVVRRARAAGSEARFVALTGYASDEVRRRATEAGFAAFITKPATEADLRAALSRSSSPRLPAGTPSR